MLTEKATFDQREARRKHHGIHLAILILSDRAFAGHLLRTVQANTLGTATEVALEKEAEQKK